MFKYFVRVASVCSVALFAMPSFAVGTFKCKEATAKIEVIVCGNEQLSVLDDQLSDAYKEHYKILETLKEEDLDRLYKLLIKDHMDWKQGVLLKCKTAKCAEEAYTQRNEEMYKMAGRLEMQIQEAKVAKAEASSIKSPPSASSSPNLIAGRDYAWIGLTKDIAKGTGNSVITCKSKDDVGKFWIYWQTWVLDGDKVALGETQSMSNRCTANHNQGQSPNEILVFIKSKKPVHNGKNFVGVELEAFVRSDGNNDKLVPLGWIHAVDLQYDKQTKEFLTYELINGKFSKSSR